MLDPETFHLAALSSVGPLLKSTVRSMMFSNSRALDTSFDYAAGYQPPYGCQPVDMLTESPSNRTASSARSLIQRFSAVSRK